jgi:formiminotetrahydrofolate cyclodeaminase
MLDASHSIDEFLSQTAARQPTPGGGSVTALVGALAAAVGEMVINYSLGKKDLEAFQGELKPALAELTRARRMLAQLMAEDQLAYETLSALSKLPPESPDRREKIPAALLACIRIPQAVAATGVAVLERCDHLVSFVNPHLLSDLAVCADLAMAAVRCAVYNVRANLKSIESESDRRGIEATVGQILEHGRILIQSVAPRIWERVSQL